VADVSEERRPTVVLVRHGATEWSESGQHTGLTDMALNANGEDEARALRPLLAGRSFALVLSSPLERAMRSAELAGLPTPEVDHDLLEWDYGVVEGRTTADMRESDRDWTVFGGPIPQGETIDQVSERVERVIARCLAADGDVALVGHGHSMRVLAARWLGLDADAGRLFHLGSGTISELDWEREQPVIRFWGLKPSLLTAGGS
jgi:broad specificity phosphatase PhoE